MEIAFALPSLPPEYHSDDYVRIEQNYIDLGEVNDCIASRNGDATLPL